jgi:hypothetical protein
MEQATQQASDHGKWLRVLLVEDNPADEKLIRLALSENGERSF